jgi:hypothetical protein
MKKTSGFLFWTPRILVILAILITGLFAMDFYSPNYTFWQNVVSLIMNLLPSIILLVLLLIAWKWEMAGGVLVLVAGLAFSIFVFILNLRRTHSVWTSLEIVLFICFPIVIAGILFLLGHFRNSSSAHS